MDINQSFRHGQLMKSVKTHVWHGNALIGIDKLRLRLMSKETPWMNQFEQAQLKNWKDQEMMTFRTRKLQMMECQEIINRFKLSETDKQQLMNLFEWAKPKEKPRQEEQPFEIPSAEETRQIAKDERWLNLLKSISNQITSRAKLGQNKYSIDFHEHRYSWEASEICKDPERVAVYFRAKGYTVDIFQPRAYRETGSLTISW